MSILSALGGISGHVAWVTGAGTGIGQSIALAFAQEGCRVAVSGRSAEKLAETAALAREFGCEVLVVPANVADLESVVEAHRAIASSLGEVDILVNNAGTNVPRRYWQHLSPEDMATIIDVNLKGPFACSLAVLPAMRSRRRGLLIHIVSNAAAGIFPGVGPSYTASKHGARALSATINAEEGIHGIRSICINPGAVATPFQKSRPNVPSAEDLASMVQPEDVAAAAVLAARMPARTCLAEILITPTDNHIHRATAKAISASLPDA
ncbi:MAG: SDR family oxidoreductase [Proteobacteria bacterium]|nr:SDR family oxidoreductase [Pseudomonadota bacterium]